MHMDVRTHASEDNRWVFKSIKTAQDNWAVDLKPSRSPWLQKFNQSIDLAEFLTQVPCFCSQDKTPTNGVHDAARKTPSLLQSGKLSREANKG